RRLILDSLGTADAQATRASLAALMGLLKKVNGQWCDGAGNPVQLESWLQTIDPILKAGTLIRRLGDNLFDPDHILFHKRATLQADGSPLSFVIRRMQLPDSIPADWQVSDHGDGQVRVVIPGSLDVLTENFRSSLVNSAGQLPAGFDPKEL